MRFLLAVMACATGSSAACAETTLFESATLGPTGIPSQDVSGVVRGTNVDDSVFVGVRVELPHDAMISEFGAHLVETDAPGTVFGAIVELDSESDFPNSDDLSSNDIVFADLVSLPEPSSIAYVQPGLSLSAGWYAFVFGGGLFGASGSGAAPLNSIDPDTNSLIGFQRGIGWGPREATPGLYLSVHGRIVPEPSAGLLAIGASVLCRAQCRRDRARNRTE